MAIIHTHIPKRKKRKPNAKQRALQASWDEIVKKYEPKKKVVASGTSQAKTLIQQNTYRRETPHYPSLNSFEGSCAKPQTQQYTGTAMMGIATLHKSNAVPVFNPEDAVEISRMRRG